ncbi:peroxidase family protein [Methylobacterium iners]|uniref:Heme peroxidase n=1 Tax=Methylobacterium iners TaxID=418707 RepID=A0ABQ4RZG7_9HYPH|nr:peroxidase family protein [Methylobacterium iners]GJD96086.1 hypothetical protein OCOJLMKI_3304 [Methylobacterium iners]
MAVHLNHQDLTFILKQIRIAEAHASGIDLRELRVDAVTGAFLSDRGLYDADGVWQGEGDPPRAVPDPHTPYGLRTVDGTFNNIVPGRENWGASGEPMPQMFRPSHLDDADGDRMPLGGGAAVTNNDYGTPGDVADADPRLISNLVVDASLGNPAAIAAALRLAGSERVIADQQAITTAYEAVRAATTAEAREEAQGNLDEILADKGITVTNGSIDNLNVAPDEGLSKPFNAWMTFFGQFFDHGLDLISKGGPGVGTVYIPLAADDPLVTHGPDGVAGTRDEVDPRSAFMVLTRATPDQGSQRNVTTPFVDQNQTYTSNPSHQVFLREYEMGADGRPVATGRLLGGENGGLATWADVKEQARTMLGIDLRDTDVSAVPHLLTDPYGAFVPGADGLPQVMARLTSGEIVYLSGTVAQPLSLSATQLPAGATARDSAGAPVVLDAGDTFAVARTFNAFLDDIAHNAVPKGFVDHDRNPDTPSVEQLPDADGVTGNAIVPNRQGVNLTYDDELLDRHYVTGDGRGNENIGLTAVHHIFHSEHNRQVSAQKLTILKEGDLAFVNEWLDAPIDQAQLNQIRNRLTTVPNQETFLASLEDGDAQTGIANLELNWNGERLFQAGRFATEMQYQHLVFEEFARKVQPQIDVFVFNSVTEIDPAIFAEFANTVYRFGHSMLTENMPRVGAQGQAMDTDLGLIESFLNPVRFDNDGALSHDEAAAAIIRGMTVERGSEIDEFVVGALRNNLLGLPLDLAAINIARGRDTGTPTLNEAREQLFAATGSTFLTPYGSWTEMAANLKNPMSVVNFIAAYGTHPELLKRVLAPTPTDQNATRELNAAEKRAVAMELVLGVEADGVTPSDIEDRRAFLNGTGSWNAETSGLNAVDLWVGGLAEKQMPFGGLLGSTFNAIFEAQLENLQDADRFYYLTRTQGQNFLNELEQNSFSKMMLANTDLALPGADGIRGTGDDIVPRHIGIDSFSDYDFELELDARNQADQNGAEAGIDPTGNDPVLEAMGMGKVMRDDPRTAGVDESATSGFHASVNALVRRYNADGTPANRLIDGTEDGAGTAAGPVTWADVKANALRLGIDLTDADLGNAPVLRVGPDGTFGFSPSLDVTRPVALVNGSFDDQPLTATTPGVNVDAKGNYTFAAPTGWSITGGQGGGTYAPVGTVDAAGLDGANVVWLRGGAALTQEVGTTLQAGSRYAFTFQVGDRNDFVWPGAVARLLDGAGNEVSSMTLLAPADGQWREFTLNSGVIPASLDGQTLRLEIRNSGDTDAQILVDDVDVTRTSETVYRSDLKPDQTLDYHAASDPFARDAEGNVLRTGQAFVTPVPTANLDAAVVNPTALAQPFEPGHYLRFTGGEHVLVGGTNGNDTIVTDFGDDGIWGDAGNDRIESGAGVDLVNGGDGDDVITDSGDSGDFLKGEGGNDVIANSNGLDILMGGTGKDVIFVGVDTTEVFAGDGDDFVLGGDGVDLLMGNEGSDWIEGGGGFDTTAGDNSELFFNSAIKGHDVMFAGGDENDFDGESGDDIMVQGESVMRNEGMFGFDWAIFKGNARDGYADMRIPVFTTEEADILRNRFDSTEGLSGWENDDTLIGDDRTAADAVEEEPGGNTVAANEGVFFNDGLTLEGLNRIAGLRAVLGDLVPNAPVNPTPAQLQTVLFEAGNILLGGAGSDTLQGNGGDDVLDGDRWLNVRISIRGGANGNGPEIATVDSLRHVFAAGPGIPPAWEGKSLFELMVARTIRPDQMHIVREVVNTGVTADDADTAVFNDVRDNYVITRVGDALRVQHVSLSDPAVDDGTDTLRNIETLRFADGEVDVALVRNQPFDRVEIASADNTGNAPSLTATVFGAVAGRGITLKWQVLDANGDWSDVPGASGSTFTPAPGVEARVVALWTETVTGNGTGQSTPSVQTAFLGTVADEDVDGSTSSNLIVGRAGDDDIAGEEGLDRILGGDGDDRLDGGAGDDVLFGNAGADILIGRTGNNVLNGGVGDDELNGGHGNDTLNGDAGTDTMVASGLVGSYGFVRAGNAITVTDDLGAEGDGIDTATGVELFQDDAGTVLNLVAGNTGTGGADIVAGNNNGNDLNGGAGNDRVFGAGGADTITQTSTAGRDFVDGGAGVDTYELAGVGGPETFRIYSRAAWLGISGNAVSNANTEIVVTRNGTGNANVVAELDNIEEIRVNALGVTTPGGANGGASEGDTILVVGTFDNTSLNFNTITVDGSQGDDTVDISALSSAHRIVFRSNGGHDTVVGTLRAQDVIEIPAGTTATDYVATTANGMTTLTNGTHAITFAGSVIPTLEPTTANGGGTGGGAGGTPGTGGAFALTAADLAGIKNLVQGRQATEDDDTANATGVRTLSGAGNNLEHPEWGAADQPFIRLTEAHYGAYDPATNNNALNPLYNGLDPRAISNVLGAQEADLPNEPNGSNIFFMAFGQYFDHGLDFLPKSAANGTVQIDQPGSGRAPGTNNPADLTRGEVHAIGPDGVPQHLNKTSPFVDQNQAYGSHELVGQFLRESDGERGVGARLLAGVPDPTNPDFNLLPTLRELINHHWAADTIFHDPSLPGGEVSFRTYFSNFPITETRTGSLFNAQGAFDPEAVSVFASNFMGSGHALLLDTNPFVSLLDHYVAGDGRANENVSLTAMHTIWARNHNFHAENLVEAGFEGTPEEVFQAAKMINEAEYARVVYDEFADQLLGGMRGSGSHGHDEYNPDVDARISHEFAAAVYRVGHSLIGETLRVIGPDGQPREVRLFDAFLNPSNAPDVFTAPLPPGYVPQPGYAQLGANAILAGVATQPAEAVDFNIVDAVRNDLVRISADLFAFNVARGRDVGLGSLNQVRADLMASTDPYIREAVGFAGDLRPYVSWEDFQARNGLSNTVIAQFRQAYPDLELTPANREAFVAANPDIEIHVRSNGTEYVSGIDRVDLWVGGLAEQHVNGGVVGQTFWVVLHEQLDRLQEGDRFYYTDRFDNFDFYENIVDGQNFSDIVARNTGLTGLQEEIFAVSDEDEAGGGTGGGDGDEDEDDDGTGTGGGDGPDDEDDGDTVGGGGSGDDGDCDDDGGETTNPGTGGVTTNPGTGGGTTTPGTGWGTTNPGSGGGTTTPPAESTTNLVAGTANGDVLSGTAGADTILGLAGEDNILSGEGADVVRGGDGNDFVDAGGGRDLIFGGASDDDLLAGSGDDMVYGDGGADRILAGAGNDLVTAGTGNDEVMGGEGNDLIVAEAGDGNDRYWGDEMGGGSGVDTLDMSAISANITANLGTGLLGGGNASSGQSGNDTLWGIENFVGGSGSDTITASDAVNVMDGGLGVDTYRFETAAAANGDTIASFQPGDRVDLGAIDANQGMAGNQAFTLASGAAFTGVGQLLVTQETRADGDYTVVSANTDANMATAEFRLSIKGTPAATAADFAL